MKRLDIPRLESALKELPLGWPLLYRQRVTSTQDLALAQAQAGAAEGVLVLAEEQTAGRGRAGRSWWAPSGTAILSSLLLRPRLPHTRLGHIGMIAGLAITDALWQVARAKATLKWPNDILLADKKLGGILIEARWVGDRLDAVVLGLGLNVSVSFPPHSPLAAEATSLAAEGFDVPREELIIAYVRAFASYYRRVHRGWSPTATWAARLDTLGRPVRVITATDTWDGVAESVTEAGELIVRRGEERLTIRAGDVSIRYTGHEEAT